MTQEQHVTIEMALEALEGMDECALPSIKTCGPYGVLQRFISQVVEQVSKREALLETYQCLNGPVKVGPKWVTYSREQVDAMLYLAKQVLVLEGYEFKGESR
jgi:hypothetical protein